MKYSRYIIFLIFHLFLMQQASSQELSDFKWKNRLLVIVTKTQNDALAEQQLQKFNDLSQELAERKLCLIQITPDSTQTFDYSVRPSSFVKESDLWSELGNNDKEFEVLLIGLDGGIKFRSTQLVSAQEIFDRIDAMPMRRSELDKN